MKRIAVQFSGLARGFKFDRTRYLIYQRFIKSFEDQGFKVDTFWSIYDIEFDDIIYNLPKEFNCRDLKIISDSKIQNFLEYDYKLLDNFSFDSNLDISGKETAFALKFHGEKNYQSPELLCKGIHIHKYGWFKWLNAIKLCTESRKLYEIANNLEYDWILLTEPSTIPESSFIVPSDKNPLYISEKKWEGYIASFLFGTPNHANYIGKMYDYLISKEFKSDNSLVDSHIQSETTFKKYIDIEYNTVCLLPKVQEKSRYWKGQFHSELSPEKLKQIIEDFEEKYSDCKK